MLRRILLVGFVLASLAVKAQSSNDDDDKNVVISQLNEKYWFEQGKDPNPVLVRKKSERNYLCQNYRTVVQVAEFYNEFSQQITESEMRQNGKRTGLKPQCEYYHQDDIFFSDTRVCFYNVTLDKKGSTGEVTFEVTEKDPRYFTRIYFQEAQAIQEGSIELKIPSWMKVEVKELNFEGHKIAKEETTGSKGETVITYRFSNLPAQSKERNKPGPSYYVPHLLVMCKQAMLETGTVNYFNTLKDQYGWYQQLLKTVGNDKDVITAKAKSITEGISGDENKVKALFLWVQDNVRYIAFEDGLAGFTPTKAQEVMAKRYGDCKGMANLLAELMNSIGLDGRRCWLGTNHIAYDYSTPSLCVDNHMIAAWMQNGKPVFLDATEKYLGYGEIAQRIQGRQTLIENGNAYLLETIPVKAETQNTSTETRTLKLVGNDLVGRVKQVLKGEEKEWMLTSFHNLKKEKKDAALNAYLSEDNQRFQISNLKTTDLDNYNQDLVIEYDLVWKDAATSFDKETYLDIDNRRHLAGTKIDSSRRLPLWMPYKSHYKISTELELPAGRKVQSLPAPVAVSNAQYRLSASYQSVPGKLVYQCEVAMPKTIVQPADFKTFNTDLARLSEFYNQQPVLVAQ